MSNTGIDLALSHQDHSLLDLTRLLTRLERSLLAPHVDPSLQRSSFQRTRIGANIEYAHNLILRLEHGNLTNKAPAQKSRLQAELQQKRSLLKKLQDRLYELNQLDEDGLDGGSSDDSDQEDLLRIYAPGTQSSAGGNRDVIPPPSLKQRQSNSGVESQLRSRRNIQGAEEDKGITTGAAVGDSPNDLTPGKSTTPLIRNSSTSANEVLLTHHSSEQEALTSSLLNLATALKTSTLAFSDSLSSSSSLVDRATSSLDRNVGGMEAAEKRMGMLRRMTEGKGWWGRLSLYAWVAVLWVALILIMFVMPKLRF